MQSRVGLFYDVFFCFILLYNAQLRNFGVRGEGLGRGGGAVATGLSFSDVFSRQKGENGTRQRGAFLVSTREKRVRHHEQVHLPTAKFHNRLMLIVQQGLSLKGRSHERVLLFH